MTKTTKNDHPFRRYGCDCAGPEYHQAGNAACAISILLASGQGSDHGAELAAGVNNTTVVQTPQLPHDAITRLYCLRHCEADWEYPGLGHHKDCARRHNWPQEVYSAVHEEIMQLRVKLHSVLNGRSDIDNIVYHAQNRAAAAAERVLTQALAATKATTEVSSSTAASPALKNSSSVRAEAAQEIERLRRSAAP